MTSVAFNNRAERLKRNPHNIGGIAGCPAMTVHEYWKARFEMEGATAPSGATNPYIAGTMASDCWQRGRDYVASLLELDGED